MVWGGTINFYIILDSPLRHSSPHSFDIFFQRFVHMPESRFAPQVGGNVRKEEPDDCPCGSESERTTELVIKRSIAKRRPRYGSLEVLGFFLEEMGKDNGFPEPNECAFEE